MKALTQIPRFLLGLVCLAPLFGRAEVKPNGLFGDGAVLQQRTSVPIWGTAKVGEQVTVKFQDQVATTEAREGRWLVKLKPLKAGGPFTLTISGENTITYTNVLVGEVWLCSGQSNMGFKLNRAENAAEAIATAGDLQLHLFTVPRESADLPRADLTGHWETCSSGTASNFSAVAYFFGRDLRKARDVPVGLIDSSVGGTPAEAWTSRATLESDPELKPILEKYAAELKDFDAAEAAAKHKADLERYKTAAADAKAKGLPAPTAPRPVVNPAHASKRPAGLYNAMIAPLQPYAMSGVIWYQGEANSGRARQYQTLFLSLIRNWREAWGRGDFPFLFVQIAPHEQMSPEIREAQFLTMERVPRTAMAVTVDVGAAKDIHPTKKEPVGARLALAARALAYGEEIEYSGPVFDSFKVDGSRAIVSFTHTGTGLVAQGGPLRGFTLAGEDGKFHEAKAVPASNKVQVTCPEVPKPVAVRYGWANVPDVNLFNLEGLPASPFRSDVPK